ncbi:MAG: hypothetical protein COB20_00530 [SAR86 cluster bacterium]|uniref:Calcineurin-like phosphoesterase domain-containing protein n=1 Tax=SAR86 cluster bacterium TaxID=2030880 RepID=A0A2A4XI06_9GAMM|nr:MAG: hypothetical protein COB20_00530 [SAR86 cluster bacterium]
MDFERIVQITDTHVVADYTKTVLRWDPVVSLRSIISSINSLEKQPQLVLATGDLVHDGLEESYHTLKSVLKTLNFPIFVTPGNHDSRENMESSLLGENIYLKEHVEVQHVEWVIAFLDTKTNNEEHGLVTPAEIDRLALLFDKLEDKNCLLAMHHSPTPECLAPACQLHGREVLLEFLASYSNSKAVVSGHTHCETEKEYLGIKLLTTPSTLFHVEHTQRHETEHNRDFMKYHEFDGSKIAYRILDLFEDGSMQSEIRWVD